MLPGFGSIYGGLQFTAGTRSPWLPARESAIEYLLQLQRSGHGKATYAVVQAEDELAVIGMAIGAGWAGCDPHPPLTGHFADRANTWLAYYAEVPVVVWNVQRVGHPPTADPHRSGDRIRQLSRHGDTQFVILAVVLRQRGLSSVGKRLILQNACKPR
jgi:2-oxoglutarate ferredoxin oxidoreductase subunit alpha